MSNQTTTITLLTKSCEHCGKHFTKGIYKKGPETNKRFLTRKFCSHVCANRSRWGYDGLQRE